MSLWDKKAQTGTERTCSVLGWVGYSFVDQQNRNVISHWVDAAALPAFQALSVVFHYQRFLANRTDQNFEKILGNHDAILRPVRRPRSEFLPLAATYFNNLFHDRIDCATNPVTFVGRSESEGNKSHKAGRRRHGRQGMFRD